jgi:two-component system cell cycle sensor histidine kinase/response regulator CckA
MEKKSGKTPLRILHLEDNRHDAEIVQVVLREEGMTCDVKRVDTRASFTLALEDEDWDLILSDYSLPAYDGLRALALAREMAPEIPFILFSGTIGEETAIECLKHGATDYILKQRPARLVSAVQQALKETEKRKRLKKIEGELLKAEADKKQLELQCLRMQRMESIGALVGGIAHDLNNALVPILVGVDYLHSESMPADAKHMLATMRASARRGADMVRHVLAFARGIESRESCIQMKFLIREMERIIGDIFPKSIQCKTKVADDLWPISGSTSQMHQVLMNLCVNGRDAMPKGGILEISAGNVTLNEEQARVQMDLAPGRYILLTVSDTGTGMPPEVLDRIFQPFFSTKDPEKGTGLGLSTTINIVKRHDGYMSVKSQLGQGSEFSIYLPAAAVSGAAETVAKAVALPLGSGELVLVVDDENAICEITKVTLENYGYKVLTAGSGAEAVAIFAGRPDEIKLVLADTEMPLMDGRTTCLELKKLRPDLKIITASGNSTDEKLFDTAIRANVRAVIQKPYTVEKLLTTVHQVLAGTTRQ